MVKPVSVVGSIALQHPRDLAVGLLAAFGQMASMCAHITQLCKGTTPGITDVLHQCVLIAADVDCGGTVCLARCPDTKACVANSDCASMKCGSDGKHLLLVSGSFVKASCRQHKIVDEQAAA